MMITDIEDFFRIGCGRCKRFQTPDCSVRLWAKGLRDLRKLCREAGLTETVKWAHPCYTHNGRNVVLIGALQGDFRLNFFNAALMKDPQHVLSKQGPNTQHPDSLRFTDSAQVAKMASTIRAYLAEAKGYAETGAKPEKVARTLELPAELTEALDGDPKLAEAFHRLTPGRQRSVVIHVGGAKQSETRRARIVALRKHIMAGKGAQER